MTLWCCSQYSQHKANPKDSIVLFVTNADITYTTGMHARAHADITCSLRQPDNTVKIHKFCHYCVHPVTACCAVPPQPPSLQTPISGQTPACKDMLITNATQTSIDTCKCCDNKHAFATQTQLGLDP